MSSHSIHLYTFSKHNFSAVSALPGTDSSVQTASRGASVEPEPPIAFKSLVDRENLFLRLSEWRSLIPWAYCAIVALLPVMCTRMGAHGMFRSASSQHS